LILTPAPTEGDLLLLLLLLLLLAGAKLKPELPVVVEAVVEGAKPNEKVGFAGGFDDEDVPKEKRLVEDFG